MNEKKTKVRRIAFRRVVLTSILMCTGSPVLMAQEAKPEQAAPAKDKPWIPAPGYFANAPHAWMEIHRAQLNRTKQGNIDVLFLGDSLTAGWLNEGRATWEAKYTPQRAANFAIGGDSTRQVLWRLQNGIVEGLAPKLVVLNIGTNNLYNDFNSGTDEEIARGVEVIVQTLREKLPKSKILVVGILPRENDWFIGRTQKINQFLAKLDNGGEVRFLDVSAEFLRPGVPAAINETLFTDKTHLSVKGYEVWGTTMAPLFETMSK